MNIKYLREQLGISDDIPKYLILDILSSKVGDILLFKSNKIKVSIALKKACAKYINNSYQHNIK